MTRVKICGLTLEDDVDAAVSAGADAVGFISGFPTSPRNLSISRAGSLISRVPPLVTPVLVTTGQVLLESSDAIKRFAPGAIQLYKSELSPDGVRASLHAQVLLPYLVRREGRGGDSGELAMVEAAVRGYDALVTDTRAEGRDGGTGLPSDWNLCAAIRKAVDPLPLLLSGGLRPENVSAAISAVAPFGVDVSSGVESAPGVKDHAKMRDFVRRAGSSELREVAE